jgi:PAS domain S-box-containing protein
MKKDKYLLEIEDLQRRLDEAEEALRAIREGEVDALVVSTPQGDQVFSLKGADYPYRVFLEAMHEGAVTLDPDGGILYCNRCFSDLLQTPLEKLIGAKFQQFVEPGNRKIFEAAFQRREQEDGKAEIYLKRKQGSPVPVLASFNLMNTVEGQFTCVVVTDLTERQAAEEKIQAELAFRKSIEDSTIVGITALDLEGRQLFANTGFCRMVGWPQEELDGKMLPFVYWPPEEAAALKKQFKSGIEGEENPAGFESRYLRRDGETFDVLIQQSPLKDARGKITGLVRSSIDITARKKMEAILEESGKQMRFLAVQLIESQEKERKRIALEIHDVLGSTLASIKFKLEDLAATVSTIDPQTLADSLNALIPVTGDIIGEVRRLQSNLRPPTLDDLGLLATLKWFNRQFQSIYTGIRIESQIKIKEAEIPDLLKITLFRVAQEALNNVAKHARADRVQLSLQKNGPEIELIIADNGAGVDLEELGRKEPGDKGIGLASMKERIEISGGRFQIQSVPGKGTTVKASWLPASD